MFIILEDNILKKKWLACAGESLRGFKTQLTDKYIKHPKDNAETPYVKYPFIDKTIWKDFVKSRRTPEFLAKRQKGKENRARNIYPRRLSRGGYDILE